MVDSKKHLRECAICKREYKYCNNCSEYDHMEPWHLRWCSSNCKDIDTVLSSWGSKEISSKEAAERLKKLDTSRMEFWNDNYRVAYNKIMEDTKPSKEEHVLSVSEELKAKEEKPKIQPKTRASKAKSAIAE